MRRREFIILLGSAAATWPRAGRAQRATIPVIGHLGSGSPNKPFIAAFHEGLKGGGFVDGQNLIIEYRFANGQYDRLPALATDLAGRGVAAIFTEGGAAPARAAKQATATIPIVFLNGDDPIRSGLVSSISRPEGNVTGVSLYSAALGPKKLELLHELVLRSGTIGVLINRGNSSAEAEADSVAAAAKSLGQNVQVIGASTVDEIERAFETFANEKVAAVLITTGAFIGNHVQRIVALPARCAADDV